MLNLCFFFEVCLFYVELELKFHDTQFDRLASFIKLEFISSRVELELENLSTSLEFSNRALAKLYSIRLVITSDFHHLRPELGGNYNHLS